MDRNEEQVTAMPASWSRRGFLTAAGVLGLGVVAVACGSDKTNSSSTTAGIGAGVTPFPIRM